jgi:hypothetical protein
MKGVDSILISDYANYMFSTNNENAFKVETNDRRLFMVRCNDEILNSQFFTSYYDELDDRNKLTKLFNFLRKYKNNKWKIGVDRVPPTQYKKELEYESKAGYIQYIYKEASFLSEKHIKATELYNNSKEWSKKNYLSNSYTITEFGIAMKDLKLERVKKRDAYYYVFKNEKDFRKHLYELDENYYKCINLIDKDEILNFDYENETITDFIIDKNDL